MNKNVAIYCRLSKEDGINESLSIVNQKKALKEYVENSIGKNYKFYIDDGYSGTNFNRPSFQKMISDINNQKIEIVICKDLSRLGRNYLQVGYYLEDYFPSNNVRFIALNDNFDSLNENEFAPFKNIINEWYAKDISKKVRFTLDNNAQNGTNRKTAFPLYGYKYNELSERVIDEVTSKVVINIFKEYIRTRSVKKVIEYLEKNKIYTPSVYNFITYNYNYEKYKNYDEEKKYKWIKETIISMLRNKEYLGHFITKKTKTRSYKLRKRVKTEDKEKYIFKNKYPKIVDEEIFNQANLILNSKGKRRSKSPKPYHRILKCGGCNKSLIYQENKNRYYCVNKKCKSRVYITCKDIEKVIDNELLYLKNRINQLSVDEIKNIVPKDRNKRVLEKRNEEIKLYIRRLIESDLKDDIFNDILVNYQNEMKNNELLIQKSKVDYFILLDKMKSVDLYTYIERIFISIFISKNKDETKNKIFLIKYNKFI